MKQDHPINPDIAFLDQTERGFTRGAVFDIETHKKTLNKITNLLIKCFTTTHENKSDILKHKIFDVVPRSFQEHIAKELVERLFSVPAKYACSVHPRSQGAVELSEKIVCGTAHSEIKRLVFQNLLAKKVVMSPKTTLPTGWSLYLPHNLDPNRQRPTQDHTIQAAQCAQDIVNYILDRPASSPHLLRPGPRDHVIFLKNVIDILARQRLPLGGGDSFGIDLLESAHKMLVGVFPRHIEEKKHADFLRDMGGVFMTTYDVVHRRQDPDVLGRYHNIVKEFTDQYPRTASLIAKKYINNRDSSAYYTNPQKTFDFLACFDRLGFFETHHFGPDVYKDLAREMKREKGVRADWVREGLARQERGVIVQALEENAGLGIAAKPRKM